MLDSKAVILHTNKSTNISEINGDMHSQISSSANIIDLKDARSVIKHSGKATVKADQGNENAEIVFTVRSGIAFKLDKPETVATYERICKLESEIGKDPVAGLKNKRAYLLFKRLFDVVFSAVVLICLSWLFAIIAIVIKIDDPKGSVIFKQTRVGLNGREFEMYKFRTMCMDAENRLDELKSFNEKTGPVFKIKDDPRITRVGKWLRKLSLDELPQFVNVFKGDISVVGPRPALPKEVAQYNKYQRQRLGIKPGITCYWQTRLNRDSITFDEWVDLDLLYISKCSFLTDCKLIIQTVGCVLTAQGN